MINRTVFGSFCDERTRERDERTRRYENRPDREGRIRKDVR
jgi:hypothetical protein